MYTVMQINTFQKMTKFTFACIQNQLNLLSRESLLQWAIQRNQMSQPEKGKPCHQNVSNSVYSPK